MKDLDFLQLVIFKHPDEAKHFPLKMESEETLTVIGIPRFIFEIEQIIEQFKITTFNRSYYQRKEVEIMENKSRYLMKITGFFFLMED